MTKTILITGATSGIGLETALALAKLNYKIFLTSRDKAKGEKVKTQIVSETGNSDITILECDFNSLKSVQSCALNFLQQSEKLDILINNAGTWENSRSETKDGIETTWAVNHLAPFLLTNLLLPTIKKTPGARIINTSSTLHKGKIKFDDPEFKKGFVGYLAYQQSKLANILFTKELAKHLQGTGVTVNVLHPGIVKTNLIGRNVAIAKWIIGLFQITAKEGAQTTIYLATSDEVKDVTGEYFAKSKLTKTGGQTNDMEAAEQLWKISLEYVKKYL